jgi:hypothetical protein
MTLLGQEIKVVQRWDKERQRAEKMSQRKAKEDSLKDIRW